MRQLIVVLLICAAAVSAVQAQNVYQWFGGEPANSDWNYGMNWMTEIGPNPTGTFGIVPDAYAKVKLNNVLWGSVASAIIDEAVSIGDIFMVDAGHLTPEDLTVVAGGSLLVQGDGTLAGQINIAYAPLGTARLIMAGGSAVVAGPLHIGWGGNGQLVIGNGTLQVESFDLGGAGGTGSVLVTGLDGEWLIRGFLTDVIQDLIDGGKITTNISGAHVETSYNDITDMTSVYAIPEPITLSLLGLGALLLRRRS